MTTTTGGSRWKDLPDDLLAAIGHRLDSRIDVFRFRSVCNSWRSSVPFPNSDEQVPPVTVRLPYPVSIDGVLDQSTICNFQFLSPIQTSSPGSSSSSDVPLPQGWLIKAEESPRAAEFVRGKGNCIYYSDDDDYLARGMLTAESVRVFQFEDRSIEKLGLLPADFDIFHPPPSPAKLSNEAGFIWRTCLD
ncbi:F-box protein At2g17690 [Linum perenne]